MKNRNLKQRTYFLRSFKISCVLLFCLCLLFLGVCIVYEQMQIINFGEYKKAVEINNTGFRFLDVILFSKS